MIKFHWGVSRTHACVRAIHHGETYEYRIRYRYGVTFGRRLFLGLMVIEP